MGVNEKLHDPKVQIQALPFGGTMFPVLARKDILLNALGLLLMLISIALPWSRDATGTGGGSAQIFGVMVPETVLLSSWMVVSLALLWWKPRSWIPIVKLFGDLIVAAYAWASIRVFSTFLGDVPGIGATVAYIAVVAFVSGALLGAGLAFRSIRASRKLPA